MYKNETAESTKQREARMRMKGDGQLDENFNNVQRTRNVRRRYLSMV